MNNLSTEKKDLIKKLKKEAQKSISKLIASTFCTIERNKGTQLINDLLASKIKEVENI